MRSLPTGVTWWLTAASLVWAWALLAVEWPSRGWLGAGVAAGFGAATWVVTRWPWPGVILTAMATLALGWMGLPPENAAPLGPLMIALVCAGYLRSPRVSVWAVPALLASIAASRWDLASIAFGCVLLLLPWWFGVLVRDRDSRRRRAAERARELTNVDPTSQARQAGVSAREEVAAEAFAVIDDAVGRMTETAVVARETLEPSALNEIHRGGEDATRRLRALLVLLRGEPPADEVVLVAAEGESAADVASGDLGDDAVHRGWGRRGRGPQGWGRRGWVRLVLGAWPAALMLADVGLVPVLMTAFGATDDPMWPPVPFLLLVVLPIVAAVVLRNRFTVAALIGTAALLAAATVSGLVVLDRDGLGLSIAAAALSWSAARAGTRRAGLAWLVLGGTILTLIAIHTPDNLPIQIAMIILPFGAAAAWSGQHAAEMMHLGEAEARQAEIEDAERAAVSDERLQLARDLHDAASHAVGTMMMQANAASVLRERDPDAARAALDAVIDIGREASVELRMVTTLPTRANAASATDAASRTSHPAIRLDDGVDLVDGIAPLIAAARRAGAHVTTIADLAADAAPEDARLLLRVIREGLANAVRHAPRSDVTVELSVTERRAFASVTNGPARPDPRHDATMAMTIGSSLGLRGLRELVGERDGELSAEATGAGSAPGSGFVLRATFATHRATNPADVADPSGVAENPAVVS